MSSNRDGLTSYAANGFTQGDVSIVTKLFGLTLLMVTFAGTANADQWFHPAPFFKDKPKPAVSAPEIDPASALSGLTMLLGGLAVFRLSWV